MFREFAPSSILCSIYIEIATSNVRNIVGISLLNNLTNSNLAYKRVTYDLLNLLGIFNIVVGGI